MKMPQNYIKIFPEYEDVFYDDPENHKKYFLPVCSINLKFFQPENDQWLHFVSVKEIYDGASVKFPGVCGGSALLISR